MAVSDEIIAFDSTSGNYLITEEQTIELFREYCAFWVHDGDMTRPHALLTSGKHSNGFVKAKNVMEGALVLEFLSMQLAIRLVDAGLQLKHVDRVVGPAMGAITLSYAMALAIGGMCKKNCRTSYVEKENIGNTKKMVFKETYIKPGEKILIVEDVYTTGSSVELTKQAIIEAGGVPLPFVAVLVNRSGKTEVSQQYKIVSLINKFLPFWEPDDCPLCKLGSEAIRPKGNVEWARLNTSTPSSELK